jgi:hypothetical protein
MHRSHPFLSAARICAAVCALAALPLLAVETKFWQQGEFTDFEKGNLSRISVRSDGRLFLAPAAKELFDSSTPYLWAVAQDSKGNLYTAGGSPTGSTAKLFEVDASGKSKVAAELEGLEIHAIAVDKRDRVYAATAPDGKVYRIANGKSEIFYDPHAKYIWALAFAANGDLYVATGDQGDIHRVTPDGKGVVFFRTEETHVRSMTVDSHGNLIVGTEPGGMILRITPAGDGFVLYQTPKREITAVAVAGDGSIYAAAVGNKPAAAPSITMPSPVQPAPPASAAPTTSAVQITVVPRQPQGPPPSFPGSGTSVAGGSEVYRIYPDGSPRKVWSNAQDVAYALTFDAQGRPVIGTGNKGNIYRLDSDIWYTLLLNLAPTQVTGFGNGRGGQIYAVTGNIGKLYQLGPEPEKHGTFESEPFDGSAFTSWGRLTYTGAASGGHVEFACRSGNVNHPQKNWSPWTPVALNGDSGSVTSPPARFLQYKVSLDTAADGKSPEITSVEIAYLTKNVAPVLREIEITPSNYKFSSPATALASLTQPSAQTISLPPLGQQRKSSSTTPLDLSGGSQSLTYAKGFVGARWLAHDDNSDTLVYKVEIRGVNETQWKLLRDKVQEKFISWDSTAFPDGKYVLRITASDAPSNPPDQALRSMLESDPFLIDNTPPQIVGLAGSMAGNRLNVQWRAKDALSVIDKAEYSINGGEWTLVEPVTHLSDSPELDYKLSVERPGSGEYTIAVRVVDEYDNQSVEKVVVR